LALVKRSEDMLQEQSSAFPFHDASVVDAMPASNEFNKVPGQLATNAGTVVGTTRKASR